MPSISETARFVKCHNLQLRPNWAMLERIAAHKKNGKHKVCRFQKFNSND